MDCRRLYSVLGLAHHGSCDSVKTSYVLTRSTRSRRSNGATQTFRRPSATSMSSPSISQTDASASSHPAPRYVPPHRNGTMTDTRYSKEQLLDLYKIQLNSDGGLRDGLPNLYVGGWQPELTNGSGSASWGRSEHNRDSQPAPDICWDKDGSAEPLGLVDMDDEEREVGLGIYAACNELTQY